MLRQALEQALDSALRDRLEALGESFQIRFDNLRNRYDYLTPIDDVMTLRGATASAGRAWRDGRTIGRGAARALPAAARRRRRDGQGDPRSARARRALLGEIDDDQENTKKARATVGAALRHAKKGPLQWCEWNRLLKVAPGKSAKAAVAELVTVAARVEEHPRLHAEIREYTRSIYEAARLGLTAYDESKKRRRVVDYPDMIDRALTLLEDEAVARELAERLKLVVVDEFQDTSPLQLALFTRLHAIPKRSTWVGDRKQCIFEFAGADPTLMEAVTAWAATEGGATEQLPSNYRSRPELVTACSRLFAAAFARHGYGRIRSK